MHLGSFYFCKKAKAYISISLKDGYICISLRLSKEFLLISNLHSKNKSMSLKKISRNIKTLITTRP